MADVIITIPKKTDWESYKKELDFAEKGGFLNYSVSHFPKNTKIGDRCYIVYRGFIVGWHVICGFEEKEFVCETTKTIWKGKFIVRTGKFHEMEAKIPMKGFQGWRYA